MPAGRSKVKFSPELAPVPVDSPVLEFSPRRATVPEFSPIGSPRIFLGVGGSMTPAVVARAEWRGQGHRGRPAMAA